MKKRILLIAILAVLLTGCGSIPKLKNGEEAIVELKDGTKYSVDEIWNEFKKNYALDLILNKVDSKMLDEEYKSKEKEVNEYLKEYETYIKSNYLDENGKLDEDSLNNALNRSGYSSLDALLETQKVGYLRELLTNDYAKTKVTDKEINTYYKDKTVGDIKAVHILVKPASSSSDDDKKAKEKAEGIIADINKDIASGTKTEDAFAKYKDNTEVTYQDLGKFSKDQMVEAFSNAAYALKKGAYSKTPVKTSYGYHIILKLDEYEKPKLEEVKDSITETLAKELVEKDSTISAQAINDLRKKNEIKFYDEDLENAYNKYMNYLLNKK